MSKVIRPTDWREFSHIVESTDGLTYLVDTVELFDKVKDSEFETAVFPWDETENDVLDWGITRYIERNSTYDEAAEAHSYICENLEEFVIPIW